MKGNNNRKVGDRFEKIIAYRLKGKVVKGSGCWTWRKGDVSSETTLIQCKHTEKNKYNLKLEEIIKNEKESIQEKKDPLFCFGIVSDSYIVSSSYKFEKKCLCTHKKSITLSKDFLKKYFELKEKLYLVYLYDNKYYHYEVETLDNFILREVL